MFTTVSYLSSTDVPPQWLALVKDSSERAPTGDYTVAETWFNQTEEEETTNNQEPIIQTYNSGSKGHNKSLLNLKEETIYLFKQPTVSEEEINKRDETFNVQNNVVPNSFINLENSTVTQKYKELSKRKTCY